MLDARNNNVTVVPSFVSSSQWTIGRRMYFEGNPICPKLGAILCAKQCAPNCNSFFLGDGVLCDDESYVYNYFLENENIDVPPRNNSGCNVPQCKYDGGDCLPSYERNF